jgi:hypothetical protein
MTDSTEFKFNKPPIFIRRLQNVDYDGELAVSELLILDISQCLE